MTGDFRLTVEHLTENGVSRSREVEIERVVGLESVFVQVKMGMGLTSPR